MPGFLPSWENIQKLNENYESSYRPEMDWSDSDWNAARRRSMRPESRQVQGYDAMGRPAQLHEYLVNGKWYSQQEYDDPLMRQNVINPWLESVQNDWRIKREKAMKDKEARGTNALGSMPARGLQPQRGGGSMGSGSRRPQYDPQMIQRLIGG